MQVIRRRLPAIALTRRARLLLAAAVGLLLLGISVLVWWGMRQDSADRPPNVASLKNLPARPEDIEAHGTRSVLAPDDARARNAAVAFSDDPLRIAKPFLFEGSSADRANALQCLATAVLYEAGDDTHGEEAVAQVVLNRVRHAAFPATVCGVVYQGSERSTGCQFTFTCDGSLRRQMSDGAWRRARDVAERALGGRVEDSVGLATHYHTDWVYLY